MSQEIQLLLIGALMGFVLSIATTSLFENLKNPKLDIVIKPKATIRQYEDQNMPVKKGQFLQLELWNRPPSRVSALINSVVRLRAALSCSGEIQFYHFEDAAPVFEKPMRMRWAGAPDAVLRIIGGDDGYIVDSSRIEDSYFRTIYPERLETIDVAARFDNDDECYGWTTENMFDKYKWRPQHLRLNQGRYYVGVTVRTEGSQKTAFFQLDNTSSMDNFRLLDITEEDRPKLRGKQT